MASSPKPGFDLASTRKKSPQARAVADVAAKTLLMILWDFGGHFTIDLEALIMNVWEYK